MAKKQPERVEYREGSKLSEYSNGQIVTGVSLDEPAIAASLATDCVYKVLRNGVPWWVITNRIINNFHKARFEPVYYCRRCSWIENGGHRLAAAKKLGIKVDVSIHSGCEFRRTIYGHRKDWAPPWEYKGMTMDVHIPTRDRRPQLHNLLVSIQAAMIEGVHIHVWFDTDEELEKFRTAYNWVDVWWLHFHKMDRVFVPPLFWNARLRETKSDVFIYLCDDTEMNIECLKELRKAFAAKFPDFDGIIGIRQANLPPRQKVPAAFGAIGMKFADRFPFRNVFCIDYRSFYIDKELGEYADSKGKFYSCESAFVNHYTPGVTGQKPDATNKHIRRFKQYDIATNKKRVRANLLWGRDFDLVGEDGE